MVSLPGVDVRLLLVSVAAMLAGCVRMGPGVSPASTERGADGAIVDRPARDGTGGDATPGEGRRPDWALDLLDSRADIACRDIAKGDRGKGDLLAKDAAKGDLPKDLATTDLPAKDAAKGDLVAAADVVVACPSGYSKINGSTSSYRVATAPGNWLPAEQACEADGTHLMIIDDANEGMLVGVVLPGTAVWTGVTDRITTGQFRKVTGSLASYLPWASGQPAAGGTRCTTFDSTTGLMSNTVCGAGRIYVCECDGLKAVAGTY
jgi:hypothetical protein